MPPLIHLAVRRPIATLMVYLCLAVTGGVAVLDMDTELLPEIQLPRLSVSTAYPGMSAAEIRELVTLPMEEALSSTGGLKVLSSISREGCSHILMEFHWGVNIAEARASAREIIDIIYPRLPSAAERPVVRGVDPDPALCLAILPANGDLLLATRLADREIRSRLQRTEGVGSVERVGGIEEEIHVLVDQSQSASRGYGIRRIAEMIAENHLSYPVGSIVQGGVGYSVETDGRVGSVEELGSLTLSEGDNRFPLREVARTEFALAERSSLFHLNGEEGVGLLIRRRGGVSPGRLSRNVRKTLDATAAIFDRDLSLRIVRDSAVLVQKATNHLGVSALLGAAAAFLVLLLFLGRTAWAAMTAVSIPVSILGSLLLLRISGRSLNIMSLGGLATGVGLIVDNGIVVVENLIRHQYRGETNADEFVIRRTKEMASATFGSTLSTVVVFVPVIFLPGILGVLFTDLALGVIYSVGISYLVSITLIPVLYKLHRRRFRQTERRVGYGLLVPRRLYRRLLRGAIRNPLYLIVFLSAITAAGGVLLFRVDIELMPDIDAGEILVSAEPPAGASMDYVARLSAGLADQIRRVEGVSAAFSSFGDGAYPEDRLPFGGGEHRLSVTVRVENRVSAVDIRNTLRELLGAEAVSVDLPRSILAPLMGITAGAEIFAYGADPPEAKTGAETLLRLLERGSPQGVERPPFSVRLLPSGVKEEIAVIPERTLLTRANVSPAELADCLALALKGICAARMTVEGRDVDIRVLLREEDRSDLAALRGLLVTRPGGESFTLGELAAIEKRQTAPLLLRRDRRDVVSMRLSAAPGELPEELTVRIRSDPDLELHQESAFRENLPRILVSLVLSVVLLYFVLGAQLESFLPPLLLMLSFPLSFSGVLFALVAGGRSLNLSSIIGVFVLLGITVNNSILLFETYQGKASASVPSAVYRGKASASALAAVYRGSVERLRPILLAMLTTVAALLPVAVDPLQRSAQSSMAAAVIGGLAVSTLLTLLCTPVMLLGYFRRRQEKSSEELHE